MTTRHSLRDWFGRNLNWRDWFLSYGLWRMAPLPKTQAEQALEAESPKKPRKDEIRLGLGS